MIDRQITHAPGCWGWGPRHYECALREIELLTAEWKRITAAQGEAEARAERLAEALRELEDRAQRDEALLRQALDALAYWLEHGETPGSHDIIQRTHDVLRKRLK